MLQAGEGVRVGVDGLLDKPKPQQPSRAAGAPVEVDISKLQPGEMMDGLGMAETKSDDSSRAFWPETKLAMCSA